MNEKTLRVTRLGLMIALMAVLGWLDRAIPLGTLLGGGLPGVRLGLANTVLLYAVWLMDPGSALLLLAAKVLLSGFLFGSLSAILYSLAGSVLSLAAMTALRRGPAKAWRVILTSVAGAMAHNLGQVLAAAAVTRTPGLLTVYLPPLLGIGAAVGILTGTVAWRVIDLLGVRNGKGGEVEKA
ncbi:MAG: Gx transporter family protein [Clostridia bacterium]|nr:Gx transporter family protein [Clostridia bacterium]